jgi:hypothetical protein
MCSIYIDESSIHMLIIARPSRLCVPFSKKLDNLLYCLDNWCMMYNFQCDAHANGRMRIEMVYVL